jgi:chromosome segregation ATPase
MSFAIRDKENAVQSLTTLQRQHDALVTQRDHWDTLAETKEQVTLLKDLITQTENDTIQELQRFKEQALIAETEHTALQRRFKEQETKISNSEKVAFTARQNLSAANQRAADWEKRAKEYQSELDSTQSKLAQLELTHSTLDAEYSHARIALDSKSDDLDRFEVCVPFLVHFRSARANLPPGP